MENWDKDFLNSLELVSFFQVNKGRLISFEGNEYPQLDIADKSDFENILKREFDKRKFNEEDFQLSSFSKVLEGYVKQLIDLHINQRNYDTRDERSIMLGYQFIDFLKENKFCNDNKVHVNPLKEKFINPKDYDRVIEKLVEEKRIVIVKDGFIFKPVKTNSQYEPFVLLQVLSDLEFFKEPLKDTINQQIHLLKKVFKGYTVSERTYSNKNKAEYYDYYKHILSCC